MIETRYQKQPLVAVVTPVYNGSPYLEGALACVQAQTYRNLVHVVLDNASTDDTPQVIARAAGGRVPILTQRNPSLLPQIDNWNAVVAMTPPDAKYVKLLCADDLMRADCVEQLVAVAESAPNVEFVTAIDVVNDLVKPYGFDPQRSVYEGRETALRLLRGDIAWMPFPHLFFKVTPERLRNPFNPEANPASDADFVLRLLQQGNMGSVNAPLFYTRDHKTTLTNRTGGSRTFIYQALARVQRYGPALMSPVDFKRLRDGNLSLILRHVLADRATGRPHLAAENLRRLAGDGFRPGLLEYLAAILTWPPHKLRKTIRQIAERAAVPPAKISETEFLARPPRRAGVEQPERGARMQGET